MEQAANRVNEAKRCLEEAADKAAIKGCKADDILRGMLDIYVYSRLGFGTSESAVLAEVSAVIKEAQANFQNPKFEWEGGPPLGKGGN